MKNATATSHDIMALVVALNEREHAKLSTPDDNPFKEHSLLDLSHGLLKSADNYPAQYMIQSNLGHDMEMARHEQSEIGKKDKSAKRMAAAKRRAERKVEFDKIADAPVKPDPKRMEEAWLVVYHLVPIVGKIAKSKQRWANRLLGSNADDIPQVAIEKMALVLAKQTKFDLDVLRTAARELAASEKGIPGNQSVDESEPDERKKVRKARKWLMGMVNNRVMGALVDTYTSVNNLRWDNLDIITTVMASVSGVGDDPMLNRFKADRAPAFLGTRFQRPGGVDANALAMAISGAITAQGLDPLVEFLLDDENRRTDGAVEWTKHAETIFLLTPGGHGAWMWDMVCKGTENHARRDNARGEKAMLHVRNLFSWMPDLIVRTIDSFDPHFIGWSNEERAVMASDFESYLGDPKKRTVLQPALKYGNIKEAASALTEHLANLHTWQDMVTE